MSPQQKLAGQALRTDQLTPRELVVVTLLGDALTAAAIARRLGISTRTVHKHLENIYQKLGIHDRLATVLRCQDAGLLPRAADDAVPGEQSEAARRTDSADPTL